jgi:hypothetical protein
MIAVRLSKLEQRHSRASLRGTSCLAVNAARQASSSLVPLARRPGSLTSRHPYSMLPAQQSQ